MTYKVIYLISSILLFAPQAYAVELCGQQAQGSLVVGQDKEIYQVFLNDKKVPTSKDGYFLLAFDRDSKLKQSLKILHNDNEEIYPTNHYQFNLSPTKWDVQKINGVPERKVTPKEEDRDEILRENQSVRKSLEENNSIISFWKKGFIMPLVDYRISGNFGGQRIINTLKKAPHRGMDLAATEGTEVLASSDGNVVLSGENFFYSGNMIIIDHGQGLHTMYAHLKDTKVKSGDIVQQGQIIGTVGKTGRATGAHLHWGASANGIRFDPTALLNIQNKDLCLQL